MKRASKPNKKITTAFQLLPMHGLLFIVFGVSQTSGVSENRLKDRAQGSQIS